MSDKLEVLPKLEVLIEGKWVDVGLFGSVKTERIFDDKGDCVCSSHTWVKGK